MPNTWRIEIGIREGEIAFRPDLPNAHIGDPLRASRNDLVIWNNLTDLVLTLTTVDPPHYVLTNPIPARRVSDPEFIITMPRIIYVAASSAHIHSQTHIIMSLAAPRSEETINGSV